MFSRSTVKYRQIDRPSTVANTYSAMSAKLSAVNWLMLLVLIVKFIRGLINTYCVKYSRSSAITVYILPSVGKSVYECACSWKINSLEWVHIYISGWSSINVTYITILVLYVGK